MHDTSQPPPHPLLRHMFGGFGLTMLIVLYLLPGVIGHDPWRGDDVQHFNAIWGVVTGHHVLLPTMVDEPITNHGPLYYWIGALFAFLFGSLLPLHDATRLATPFLIGLSIFWVARTASRLYGKHTRTAAALLMLGTLGLVIHAHEHQPLAALMMAQALTLAGMSLIPTHPLKGSLQAGAGTALAFMAGGLGGLFMTLPLFLLITLFCPQCHTPRTSGAIIPGLTLALLGAAAWPFALNQQAPEQLTLWWEGAWGRLGRPLELNELPEVLELTSWFVWPLWPIALWALWRARRQLRDLSWALPGSAFALALAWIGLRGSTSPEAMLPLIVPLALLAAAGVPSLRRGAANAFDWFAIMTFAVFAILVWLAWSAQTVAWPPGLARSLARMAPEFVLQPNPAQIALGAAICVIWIGLVWLLPRSVNRGPANWAMGMTMLWCLAVTLLMPWFDHSRNYRPMVQSAAIALAGEPDGCVASLGLSSSHRAAFDYFGGLRPGEIDAYETACRFLLIHDDRFPDGLTPTASWQLIWEYRHAGGKRLETFRLYRRDPDPMRNAQSAPAMTLQPFQPYIRQAPGMPLPGAK